MIAVHNQASDGWSEIRFYKTLKGAREYCKKYLGQYFDFGVGFTGAYAISGDGINRLTVEGTTFTDLFPERFERF